MRLLLLPFFLLLSLSVSAQLGVQATANFNQARDVFQTGIGTVEGPDFEVGSEVALNYWFRLPKQRIEFLPTVYYATAGVEASESSLAEYGAQMKVNVYLFDFLGDCDCPTFGKQGPQLQKGLFLQLSAGYAFYDFKSDENVDLISQENGNGATFGAGVGLDFGLSNLVTLTPIASVRVGTSPFDNRVFGDIDGAPIEVERSKLTTFQAGLLVSFRFDHKKY